MIILWTVYLFKSLHHFCLNLQDRFFPQFFFNVSAAAQTKVLDIMLRQKSPNLVKMFFINGKVHQVDMNNLNSILFTHNFNVSGGLSCIITIDIEGQTFKKAHYYCQYCIEDISIKWRLKKLYSSTCLIKKIRISQFFF